MIEAIELTKSFGTTDAVRGVSFQVEAGEAVGFLGPNGAGKTTTFRMIAGSLGPTSGTVRLLDKDLSADPVAAKRSIGYMAENPPLYPELTAAEYLSYRAELKGIERRKRAEAMSLAANQTAIETVLGTRISHLSKGYRQRVALADALLGSPPILLLDEPTSGLDPNQILDVRELIRSLAKDHAILLSTHVLSEVEATCSRAIIIHEGRVVAEGPLDRLRNDPQGGRAVAALEGDEQRIREVLGDRLIEMTRSGSRDPTASARFSVRLHLGDDADILAKIVEDLVRKEILVFEARRTHDALDEVFAQLTGREAEGGKGRNS